MKVGHFNLSRYTHQHVISTDMKRQKDITSPSDLNATGKKDCHVDSFITAKVKTLLCVNILTLVQFRTWKLLIFRTCCHSASVDCVTVEHKEVIAIID